MEPMGIAVDQQRRKLYVADPGAGKIIAFDLRYSRDDQYLGVAGPATVATGTTSRWVTVDGEGSIYFSDEAANRLLTISKAQADTGNHTPQVLYDGASLASISSPGGVAVDKFWIYFVNKQSGSSAGSVVKAPKAAPPAEWAAQNIDELNKLVQPLATNSEKSYGVCMATQNLFYTQPDTQIFGVLASGNSAGHATQIAGGLVNPRGCAFDGDGTVYVADRGANAVYSFGGNQQKMKYALLQKTVDFQDVFDVAVFAGASRLAGMAAWTIVLLLGAITSH